MRITLTFILRLLVDTDNPQALRGVIRAVSGAEEHTFANWQSLLVLLRQMTDKQQTTNIEPSIALKALQMRSCRSSR